MCQLRNRRDRARPLALLFAGFWLFFGDHGDVRAADLKQDAETFFELRIRPILAGTCFECHGGKKVSGELRVDSRAALLKGGESGPAIVPGHPDKSLLLQAIRHTDAELKMPPDRRLPDSAIADFAAWIKTGAPWPKNTAAFKFRNQKHWAFEPVKKVSPPPDPSGWAHCAIDLFVAAGLRKHHLKPAVQAEKRVLLRRVSFDLIGLPPTPDELAAFLRDDSPTSYERVVERLLASPHYGERWGRHWMDVVRYADTAGDNADYPVPEAHRYRDYIIDSFNADKPYDRFVEEQIAGDILARQGPPQKYAEQVVATGFLALSRRYATAPYELWHLTMEDTIETTGRAFLGLTLRCARCHDHKFDPVTKEDYYALYGFFASTQFPWAGAEEFSSMKRPRQFFVPLLPPRDAAPRLKAHQQRLRDLQAQLQRIGKGPLTKQLAELNERIATTTQHTQLVEAAMLDAVALRAEKTGLENERTAVNQRLQSDLSAYRARIERLQKTNLPTDLPGAYAVQDSAPVDMYVHVRGEVEQHGPVVKRNVPVFLSGGRALAIPAGSSGRLQLAQWLTRPENPLTARVMVNRLWQHHFGKGIVATPSNFGTRGEAPTHPELLDWLASRFVASGWSIKTMHRTIVLSRTYRMASAADEAGPTADPGNRWYWRYDRRRLDAEAIRDAMLMVSGNLNESRPGGHPFPPMDQWHWTQHNPFKAVYPSTHRSVYLMTQRIQRHPFLALFDGPDTNTTTARRGSSTVPQQALFLMNNPFVKAQAEGFARRLIACSPDAARRIELAHQLAWSRPATPSEMAEGIRYIAAYERELTRLGVAGETRELEAWTSYARIVLSANELVYLD
jgi:hypothetical protein